MLVYKGKISSVSKKDFEGKISYSYQFIDSSSDDLKIIKIKSDKDLGHKKGDDVEFLVSVSSFNNVIFYKII